MESKSTADTMLSSSTIHQLGLEHEIASNHLKLLFPHFNQNKNACVQTTPEVDVQQMPWMADLRQKTENLCDLATNMLNSYYHYYNAKNLVSTDGKPKSRIGSNGALDSGLKIKLSSQHDEETLRLQLETIEQIGIEGCLKEIVELAKDVKNSIPALDSQPKNFKSDKKIPIKSLIPERKPNHKRINDICTINKPRRSNSMPDLFEAKQCLDKFQSMEKLPNVLEEAGKVASGSRIKSKGRKNVPSASSQRCLCKDKINVPTSRYDLRSKIVDGADGVILPIASTKTRTMSQSTERKRTNSVKPRWK